MFRYLSTRIGNSTKSQRRRTKSPSRDRRLPLLAEALERREVMSANWMAADIADTHPAEEASPSSLASTDLYGISRDVQSANADDIARGKGGGGGNGGGGGGGGNGGGGGSTTIPPVPVHHSKKDNPAATLYLDFDGHFEKKFSNSRGTFRNIDTPVFDLDEDPESFSPDEEIVIHKIWQLVAEDYTPFDLDVTTEDPGDFSNGVALRVAIGGTDDWYTNNNTFGTSSIDNFTSDEVNTVFVFSSEIVDDLDAMIIGDPSKDQIANAIAKSTSHEAGHGFGLEHHTNSRSGTFSLMRQGRVIDPTIRTVWHNQKQDDLAELASDKNGFGYRVDDHGDGIPSATWVDPGWGATKGVIEQTGDAEYFAVWHGGGFAYFAVEVAAVGANLDAVLEVRDAKGNLVASPVAPSNSLGAFFYDYSLSPGLYHVVVRSQGEYGDVGQYTLNTSTDPDGWQSYAATGPSIIYSGFTTTTLGRELVVTFDKPINASTFSTADVTLENVDTGFKLHPSQVLVANGNHGGRTFRIVLPSSLSAGFYEVRVGPGIYDSFGNIMDQDKDGIKGEPSDYFVTWYYQVVKP